MTGGTHADAPSLHEPCGQQHRRRIAQVDSREVTHPKGNVFLQALEGARTAVNALYCSIVRDPRHRDITLIDYTEIEERIFAGWRMGSVDVGTVNPSAILRYSEKAVLDPYSMSGRAALALLEELATSGAIVGYE